MWNLICTIFIISVLSGACESSNILVIVPFTSTSHYKFLRPIGLELARRGHNVTIITAHKETNRPQNYREVVVDDIKIWDVVEGGRPNVFEMESLPFHKFQDMILLKGGLFTTENALKSKSVVEFMKEDRNFDLIISELFYQEAFYMFAHKYKAPLVLVTAYGNCMKANFITRNPMQLSTLIHEFGKIRNPKTFYGRLINLFYVIYDLFWFYLSYLPAQEKLANEYMPNLPTPIPSLKEIFKNVSLLLMNSHFSYDVPAAYYPNFVEIAGIHLSEFDQVLPKDLQMVLDAAEHGVVYVNFGSNIHTSELPPHKRDAFLNVFRHLKQKVLFKWEESDLPNKPDNVIIRSWFPQKEILAHPNIKLFIAHGGLIGFQEAIINKVPILGIPIYADQYNNLLQAKDQGFASILEYQDINEYRLTNEINKMLKEEYKKNAEIVGNRFLDRPMSAMNTSMFWIEYVLRHKGASFMKSPAVDMSWVAYNMIDIYCFLLLSSAIALYLIKAVFNLLTKTFKSNKIKQS